MATEEHPLRIDWVLHGELALGLPPCREADLEALEAEGVRAVLSLCEASEVELAPGLGHRFAWLRRPLPDHRTGRPPSPGELGAALEALEQLQREQGPVYVHCLASRERSPLLCLAWLMGRRRLSLLQALDHLMQVHPGTCPLANQLAVLARALPPSVALRA